MVSDDISAIRRAGALKRWANVQDRSAATAPAREALQRRYEDQVDPQRLLEPDERTRLANEARRADLRAMSKKGHAVRWGKKADQ